MKAKSLERLRDQKTYDYFRASSDIAEVLRDEGRLHLALQVEGLRDMVMELLGSTSSAKEKENGRVRNRRKGLSQRRE